MNRQGWCWICACLLGLVLLGCSAKRARVQSPAVTPNEAPQRAAPEIATPVNGAPQRVADESPHHPTGRAGRIRRAAHFEPPRLAPLPQPQDGRDGPEELPAPAPERELTLAVVIDSVQRTYPLLDVVERERAVAEGKLLAAWGEFDVGLRGHAIQQPLGFYENYRQSIGLHKPMYRGGYVAGGYRIGDGFFEPWFGERETDEGGELAMEFGVPLLKDRRIDKRRTGVQQARLAREAVEPEVRTQLLDFVRSASQVYWTWVAAGAVRDAQQELLELSRQRVEQIEKRIEAGDLARNAGIDNQRLIASRETTLIEARRKFQMAAIKLSLFFRTPDGKPIVPDESLVPEEFPRHRAPVPEAIEQDIAEALAARPELARLNLLAQQARVELAQAQNLALPKLDAKVKASQDAGGLTSSKGDKQPFKLEAGLFGEVPLQRREARGKVRAAQAKLAQLAAKREFVVNKITAQVQDAVSAMDAAAQRIDRASQNLELARQSLQLARESFNAGDIDVILLNIYEQAVTDARLLLIAAQADFFMAEADYRAALALPPQD